MNVLTIILFRQEYSKHIGHFIRYTCACEGLLLKKKKKGTQGKCFFGAVFNGMSHILRYLLGSLKTISYFLQAHKKRVYNILWWTRSPTLRSLPTVVIIFLMVLSSPWHGTRHAAGSNGRRGHLFVSGVWIQGARPSCPPILSAWLAVTGR